jgi:hypothetical protein
MSIDSALIALHIPTDRTSTERGNELIAVIRRLVGRPPRPQGRPYLKIGDSYGISNGRSGYARGSNWVHAHH